VKVNSAGNDSLLHSSNVSVLKTANSDCEKHLKNFILIILCKMPSCAVSLCNSTHRTMIKIPELTFHKFPTNKTIRSIWISKCKRKDKINVKNAVICSLHFKKEDVIIDRISEALNMKYVKKLVKGTIPTLNLPLTFPEVKKSRSHRLNTNATEISNEGTTLLFT